MLNKIIPTTQVAIDRIELINLKKRFPLVVIEGDFERWANDYLTPVSNETHIADIEHADIKLFNQYRSLRAQVFEIVVLGIKKKPLTSEPFEESLDRFVKYLESDWHKKDENEFQQLVEKRRLEWEHFQKSILEEPKEVFKEESAQINFPPAEPRIHPQRVEQEQASTPPLEESEPLTQEPAKTKNKKTKEPIIPKLPFPPFIILKKVVEKRNEERELLISAHDLCEGNLRISEESILEAEKGVRRFDNEKERYIYSRARMPNELLTQLNEANEVVLEATRKRNEAAKIFYEIRGNTIDLLIQENIKAEQIRPTNSSKSKKFTRMEENKALELFKELDSKLCEITPLKEILLSALKTNPTSFEKLEVIVKKILANDPFEIEKLIPKDIEIAIPGEIDKIKIGSFIKRLQKKTTEFNQNQEQFDKLHPEDKISFLHSYLTKQRESLTIKERNLDLLEKQLYASPRAIEQLQGQIAKLEMAINFTETRYYKAVIENIKVSKTQTIQRNNLGSLIVLIKETVGLSLDDTAAEEIPNLFYLKARGIGSETPKVSLSGIEHDPSTTEYASQKRNGVEAPESDYWQYRIPTNIMENEIVSDYADLRFSCRLVANPKTIDRLDELAAKFKFKYKVPDKEKFWNRADTVTIYCTEELSDMDKQEVAKGIQDFVLEGDDSKLLGKTILNDTGQPYKGIRFDRRQTLLQLLPLVRQTYEIDLKLGDVVSNYFKISLVNSSVRCSASPGMVEGIRILLEDLNKIP